MEEAARGGKMSTVSDDQNEGGLAPDVPAGIDTSVAHPARVYDYWLGGKDNFAADREAAEQAIRDYPAIVSGVRAQRAFLARAVRYLAGQAAIRQFLDIGTGLPSANNTHEVAQAIAPDSRVVYVDNDPMVLTFARALLASGPSGISAYLDADLRDTGTILERAADTLDFTQPVAILLIGIMQLIGDSDAPHAIVRGLMDAVPSGSWLALAHPASDVVPEVVTMAKNLSQRSVTPTTLRSHAEISRFFDGLELLPPGVVQLHRWNPGALAPDSGEQIPAYCGLARKP
jgi:S-adenosyl methyltransferase